MNTLTKIYGEPISVYTTKQAIDDGILVKTGYLQPNNIPVLFTSNLFYEVKNDYKNIINKGLELLKQPNKEDTDYMKLRVIEKNKIWVIANAEGVTFMKPEDY
jgi:type I site-specific restriction endonuclease